MTLQAAPHIEQRLLRFGRVMRTLPAAPGISARENDLVVPNREPMLRIKKTHTGQQHLRRDQVRLHPAPALIIRQHDHPAIPDRDQPLARCGESNQQRVRRKARVFRVAGLRYIGRLSSVCRGRSRERGKQQHGAPATTPGAIALQHAARALMRRS